MTIRTAVERLHTQGLIVSVAGKGRFVADGPPV
jgi:DNA-binding GntR family transcriptional regulator